MDHCEEDLEKAVSDIRTRAEELNGKFEYHISKLPVLPIEILSGKLISSQNEELKTEIFSYHTGEMYEAYTKFQDIEKAYFHGELALLYNHEPDDSVDANGLGYLSMVKNDIKSARELFSLAIKNSSDFSESALARYNFGVLLAKTEDWHGALDAFEIAKVDAEKLKKDEQEMSCLIIPVEENCTISNKEVLQPNLLETIEEAIIVLKAYLYRKCSISR
jgi:tetratricopeptide (TPR) repeat protein